MRTLLTIAFCLSALQLSGQEVQVRVGKQKPPHYVGRPVVIQFTADGFDKEPTPTVEVERALPPGLRAQTVVRPPRVVSSYSNINGRISQYERITHIIQYVVTADKPGDYVVGPFVVKQGAKQANVEIVPMSFEAVPEDADMRVRLILPEGNVYPDQRVPVKIEWCYSGETRAIQDLAIYSPLFDQFRFAPDREPRRGDSQLPIATKDGQITLAASATKEEREGRTYLVVTATRTMIPDRVGKYELAPITATLEKATSWTRSRSGFDDFGFGSSLLSEMMGEGSRPASTSIGRAVGEPQTLIVKPFPLAGQPESFAGAVGDGFSIDVSADRTVVRVGDPIRLDVTLRGRGNLENASLPPLSADGGLNPDLFRLPEGDVPGRMADGAKEFDVSVRVSDESVGAIPALAYSWFDPATETYHTAKSKPIALRVMPAQVISADDVVSKAAPSAHRGSINDSDEEAGREVASAAPKTPAYSLSGADLAIEPLAGAVLRNSGHWSAGLPIQLGLYGAGLMLMVVALVDRRRKDVDPALIARRRNIRHQQEKIARAGHLPQKEAASEIATAMRALVAELPDVARDDAQAVIASCESVVFAPDASSASGLDTALIDRAKKVASRFRHSSASESM